MRSPYLVIMWGVLSCLTAVANDASLKAAFVKGNEIYRADAAGHIRQITSDGARKWVPVWSEDGQKLAFMREAPRTESLGHLVVVSDSGEELADIPVQPAGSPPVLRFVETVQWIAPNRIAVGGSINPSTIVLLIINVDTGKQVDETDSDIGDPVFPPDGAHDATLSGSPHFTPEDLIEPELDIDGKRVYPNQNVRVSFPAMPVWSPDSSKLAVVAEDVKANRLSVVTWHNDGQIASAPLPLTSHGANVELFWQDSTVICKAAGRAWKVGGDFRSVIEIPPGSAKNLIEMRSRDEDSMLVLVKQAGGTAPNIWCRNCALAARTRKASIQAQ